MRAAQFIKGMKEAVAPAPVVPNAATQARIAAAPQGYDPTTGKPVAAPGVAPVKKGGTLAMTKKVMTPDQIKQYNAKQAAAKQATAAQPAAAPAAQQQPAAPTTTAQPTQQQPAAAQPGAAPAAQQQPATPKAPWDPATGQGVKYDGITGEPTPAWQKELERQEAARLEKVEANRVASQADAAERDVRNAELVRQGVRQNPSNVTNNVTQTTAAPGNVKIANGAPAQVKAAMQAKIAAMQAKNPKLAAAMQAEIDALDVAEGADNKKIGGRHDPDDFDDMVTRLKKLAGAGPMRTVYDPDRRVYRNMPTAQQPAQQPKKAPR
jgi:hypothetical protein